MKLFPEHIRNAFTKNDILLTRNAQSGKHGESWVEFMKLPAMDIIYTLVHKGSVLKIIKNPTYPLDIP